MLTRPEELEEGDQVGTLTLHVSRRSLMGPSKQDAHYWRSAEQKDIFSFTCLNQVWRISFDAGMALSRSYELDSLLTIYAPETLLTLGQAGVRDPDQPCYEFEEGPAKGGCWGDGHYLCRTCLHYESED